MILIRYLLIIIIGYLIVRSFINYGEESKSPPGKSHVDKKSNTSGKKVSREIGEYIDYEEIKKKK